MYIAHRTGRANKALILFIVFLLALAVTLGILLYLSNSNLNNTREQLTNTQHDLYSTQVNLSETQIWLTSNQTQLDRMTSGYGYVLNDPTFAQMTDFLASDTTDQHVYDISTYNHLNFAADMIANASKEYIRCGFVCVNFSWGGGAHACVVFNTTDKGLCFIEPQTDDIVKLQVGKACWEKIWILLELVPIWDPVESYTIAW